MSKLLRILIPSLLLTCTLQAQNIQLHYDFGEDRDYLTSTVEMFRPDAYGSTFFFVDMNYDANGIKGVSESYFEITRSITLDKDLPIGLHVEYNGGEGQFANAEKEPQAYTISDAYLAGLDFIWNAEDFSKGVTLQTLYKYIRDLEQDSFQITLVWYCHLMEGKVTFNGFADFWGEDVDFNFDGQVDDDVIFLAEPQIWYNLTDNWAVGSEIEFAYNFAGTEGWKVCPTAAVKATF